VNPISYLETGVLYCDDNLQRLSEFPPECIDLIYLDPPFFSNKNYEVIWGDEAEVRSFEDRWEGGISVYIDWMRQRVEEMHRILKPTGSFYLHCDDHAGHYLKVMLDDIFGRNQYRNEIVWHYRRWTGRAKRFQKMHDTLFFYTKTDDYFFKPLLTPYTEGSKARKEQGVLHRFKKGEEPVLVSDKALQKDGVPENDVWQIPFIAPSAAERLGYPTQKPEALLKKVVEASCPPGGIVLDPFCGCGTTIAVAQKQKRQWIGIDISPTAVNLIKSRLARLNAFPKIEGLPVTVEDLKLLKPFEFQNWVIQRVHGSHSPKKSGDMGIDGYSFFEHLPIQVKQSSNVGRNVVDNFETAVERAGKHMGYIIAFSFTRNAYEEAARAKMAGKQQILLVKVGDLLRVGHLLETTSLLDLAEQLDEQDLALPAPDLMGLFSAYTRERRERPLPKARPRKALPSAKTLIGSDIDP
jgi:DNA modification methylase